MQNAIERCYRAVPPNLENLRPKRHGDTIALKCVSHKCIECKSFEVDGRIAFESSLKVNRILPWCCDDAERRRFALNVGVDDLPAYILIPSHGAPRVLRP